MTQSLLDLLDDVEQQISPEERALWCVLRHRVWRLYEQLEDVRAALARAQVELARRGAP